VGVIVGARILHDGRTHFHTTVTAKIGSARRAGCDFSSAPCCRKSLWKSPGDGRGLGRHRRWHRRHNAAAEGRADPQNDTGGHDSAVPESAGSVAARRVAPPLPTAMVDFPPRSIENQARRGAQAADFRRDRAAEIAATIGAVVELRTTTVPTLAPGRPGSPMAIGSKAPRKARFTRAQPLPVSVPTVYKTAALPLC
jgi:hypothetical protein